MPGFAQRYTTSAVTTSKSISTWDVPFVRWYGVRFRWFGRSLSCRLFLLRQGASHKPRESPKESPLKVILNDISILTPDESPARACTDVWMSLTTGAGWSQHGSTRSRCGTANRGGGGGDNGSLAEKGLAHFRMSCGAEKTTQPTTHHLQTYLLPQDKMAVKQSRYEAHL